MYLEEIDFPTYYSPGAKERALELADIAKNSVHYLDEFFRNKVQNRLLVLSEEDLIKRIARASALFLLAARASAHAMR